MSHIEDNKRLAKNTIALYIRTSVVLIVQLFITRLVLQALGADDFGLYNVVGSVVVLFSFLNQAMSSASQRFITFELGKRNAEKTKRVFSVSMTIQIIMAVVMFVVVEGLGLWMLNFKLNIPTERMVAANWAFQFSMISFCINTIKIPYDASVIAYERLTFFAYASIFDVFAKLSIAIILLDSSVDRLIQYTALLTIETLIMFVIYRAYCKKKFKTCSFSINKDKSLYKQIFSFTGWSIFGSASNMITHQGFIFLINIYFGVLVNAALGIANQVSAAVASFVNSFQTSYRPQIIKSYAQGDLSHTNRLISVTSKMSFSLMIIPTLILIFNMSLFLETWLTDVPLYTVNFCQIILICTIIDAFTSPYNIAITATGKIKDYQLWISLSFLLDLIISYILIKVGLIPYLVLISRIATRGLLNMFIGLYYIKNRIRFNIRNYIKDCLIPILLSSIIIIIPSLICYNKLGGWKLLIVSSMIILSLGSISLYFIAFNKDERIYLANFAKFVFKLNQQK